MIKQRRLLNLLQFLLHLLHPKAKYPDHFECLNMISIQPKEQINYRSQSSINDVKNDKKKQQQQQQQQKNYDINLSS